MTRALLLDLGNVLVRFDHGLTLRRLGEAAGVPPESLRPHLFGPLVRELDLGRLSTSEFFRRAEAAAGLPPLPDEVWTPAWRDIFEPLPDALAALARVRSGIPKILVSNTNSLHWEGVLKVFDVTRLVDATVLSFREGRAKPDPAFFATALAEAGVRARDAVFADDHLEYVEAARRLGLDAFAVDSPRQFADGLSRRGLLEPL